MKNKIIYKYTAISVNNIEEILLLDKKVKRYLIKEDKNISAEYEINFLFKLVDRTDAKPPYILLINHKDDNFISMTVDILLKSYHYSSNSDIIQSVYNCNLFKSQISYKSKKLLP